MKNETGIRGVIGGVMEGRGEKPPRAKRCENCAAFQGGDRTHNTCRAALPNLVLSPGAMGNTGVAGLWPPVKADDWCLQHRPIETYEAV